MGALLRVEAGVVRGGFLHVGMGGDIVKGEEDWPKGPYIQVPGFDAGG